MEEDIQLINKVKNDRDESSLKELIERHSGIYLEMVNKYLPESIEGINKLDVVEDKNFCIYDAAIKFDESKKTKFSTYVGNLARWKCLNIYNKKIKFPQESICGEAYFYKTNTFSKNSSSDIFSAPNIFDSENQEDINNIFSIIDKAKDKRVKKIFKMRYQGGRKLTPWKKIAKKLSLSIQGCINIHNKHLEEIKRCV